MMPIIDAIVTITPSLLATMPGRNALWMAKFESTLTFMVRSTSAILMSRSFLPHTTPALKQRAACDGWRGGCGRWQVAAMVKAVVVVVVVMVARVKPARAATPCAGKTRALAGASGWLAR